MEHRNYASGECLKLLSIKSLDIGGWGQKSTLYPLPDFECGSWKWISTIRFPYHIPIAQITNLAVQELGLAVKGKKNLH